MTSASQSGASHAQSDDADAPVEQAAAMCFRVSEGKRKPAKAEVLLITSRAGDWAIPKGRIDPGFTPPQAAANEAWEEAGVKGEVVGGSIGSFEYVKIGGWAGRRAVRCRVRVFPLRVGEVQDEWQESGFRKRRWVSAQAAASEVSQPGLARVLEDFPEWITNWSDSAPPSR